MNWVDLGCVGLGLAVTREPANRRKRGGLQIRDFASSGIIPAKIMPFVAFAVFTPVNDAFFTGSRIFGQLCPTREPANPRMPPYSNTVHHIFFVISMTTVLCRF
eukprot:GEMP01083142.1.p1 GENE.GEMP01083142.1~~GEMP01083142.1.p1  ORF type:complete len:104 (+),score=0.61 GEMP01083142.1:275-586(+)